MDEFIIPGPMHIICACCSEATFPYARIDDGPLVWPLDLPGRPASPREVSTGGSRRASQRAGGIITLDESAEILARATLAAPNRQLILDRMA